MIRACSASQQNQVSTLKTPIKENHQKARSNGACVLITCIALPVIFGLLGLALVIAGGFFANPPMITVGVSILGTIILGIYKACLCRC